MAENIIAIVLPEFEDKDNPLSSDMWKSSKLNSDEEFGTIIKEIAAFIDFFEDEESRVIYDGNNMNCFTFPLRELPECYPSRERELHFVLKNLENWRRNKVANPEDKWTYFHNVVEDEIRSELATRSIVFPENSYVIAACVPDYTEKTWTLTKDEQTINITSYPMKIKVIFDWQSQHHKPKREYNWNKKHGEFGKGAHTVSKGNDVAVLLGSRDEAKVVLQRAVGNSGYDFLYAYDDQYAHYMEFKAEVKCQNMNGTEHERLYHSYHLPDDSTIGTRIKKKLALLGQTE